MAKINIEKLEAVLNSGEADIALGTGVAGTLCKVNGKQMLVALVNLDHAEMPISEGQKKAANQAGRSVDKIVPYICKGNGQLSTGHMVTIAVKPLRNRGAAGGLFD